MNLDHPLPRRLARLLDALADEILGAPDRDVIASQDVGRGGSPLASLRRELSRLAACDSPFGPASGFDASPARPESRHGTTGDEG